MKEKFPEPDRETQAAQLIEDFNLQGDAEFFSDPTVRVDFLKSLDSEEFFDLAQHVNARVRGYEPREKVNAGDKGSYLPLLKTPDASEKPEAFRKGFDAIQKYLRDSNDSDQEKAKGAGMAVEALLIWVHAFNDGNGRTSRFLGSFIENGTTNTDQLINSTADKNERMRMYPEYLRLDNTSYADDPDLMLDDHERDEIRAAQEALPITEGIAQSLTRLLEDKSLQQRVEADAQERIDIRHRALERRERAA